MAKCNIHLSNINAVLLLVCLKKWFKKIGLVFIKYFINNNTWSQPHPLKL